MGPGWGDRSVPYGFQERKGTCHKWSVVCENKIMLKSPESCDAKLRLLYYPQNNSGERKHVTRNFPIVLNKGLEGKKKQPPLTKRMK